MSPSSPVTRTESNVRTYDPGIEPVESHSPLAKASEIDHPNEKSGALVPPIDDEGSQIGKTQLFDQQQFIDFNQQFDADYHFDRTTILQALKHSTSADSNSGANSGANSGEVLPALHESTLEAVLCHWRQHYLLRAKAAATTNDSIALQNLELSITCLNEIKTPKKNLIVALLICHSKALVYYEMGVHHRELAIKKEAETEQDYEEDIFIDAKKYFNKVLDAYQPVVPYFDFNQDNFSATVDSRKRKTGEEKCDDLESLFQPIMLYFNANTPYHCIANAFYNVLCLDADNPDKSDFEIIEGLAKAKSLCQRGDQFLKAGGFKQFGKIKKNAVKTKKSINQLLGTLQDNQADSKKPATKKLKKTPISKELAALYQTKSHPSKNRVIDQPLSFFKAHSDIRTLLQKLGFLYESMTDDFLKGHQKIQIQHLLNGLISDPRMICQMPTGTGKTAVMAALISLLNQAGQQDQSPETRPCIIITVPTRQLLLQTRDKLIEYGSMFSDKLSSLSTLEEKVGVWYDTTKSIRPITVTTYSSLSRLIKKYERHNFDPEAHWAQPIHYFHPNNKNVLLIFDEAHRCNGRQISQALKSTLSERAVIGFSGSAGEYEDTLPLKIVPPLELRDAIDQKAIASIQFLDMQFTFHQKVKEMKRRLALKPGEELTKEQKREIDEFLVTFSGITLSVGRTLQEIFISKDPSVKIMVFCNTKLHANNVKEIFNTCGIKTVISHGDLSPREQADQLRSFENDPEVNVVVSCGQLDEGYDFPRDRNPKGVSVVVDFVPHLRKGRLIQQRLGRATRNAVNDENKMATYIRIKLIAGDTQKEPWKLLEANGKARFHGCEEQYLNSSDPFTMQPLLWKPETTIPNMMQSNASESDNMLMPFSARLRFAHSFNNTIKLGEGVPDTDQEEDSKQSGVIVDSGNDLDQLDSFEFQVDPVSFEDLFQRDNRSELEQWACDLGILD